MREFNLYNITTWGLERDRRYGGFKLPLVFKDFKEEREKIIEYSREFEQKMQARVTSIYGTLLKV